jgi:very-short-patch-repair endonuclease
MHVMRAKVRNVEREIARIATRAHGIVTRAELSRAGLSRAEIEQRVRCGLLIRVHQGVYRVGHAAPSVLATYTAAVKACGDGAALSGHAAAHLLGLLKSRRPPPPEVTAPTERRAAGVRTRRRKLDRREVTTERGIPSTTVAKTLVDLAADLTDDDLARACHEANVKYRTTPAQVNSVIAGCPRTQGVQKLRRVMSGDTKVTLSKLERLFLKLLRDAGLPLPETNVLAGRHRVDCRWPAHEVTVELLGYRFHNSRYAWEQDHARRRAARARGDAFLQFTWDDVTSHAHATLEEIRGALRRQD